MQVKFFISVLLLFITSCFTQEEFPRPSFPDVFQTEIEGTFIEENGVVEIDASMFYDRTNNRAALFFTKEGDLTKLIYNFDSDEAISIDDNDCDVQEIPEEQGFFPFTVVEGKKKMSAADEAFYFSKSELDKETVADSHVPTLIYKATINIPQYGKMNCDLTHIFSKPSLELPTCREGLYCNSTLMTISVRCKNENDEIDVDHTYRFSRFKSQIEDKSIFLPPPGIYCKMKSTKTFPKFPSYFSFTFDIIERPKDSRDDSAVFNTHKEVWYDAEYRIIRIDEFDHNGLLYASRIFDLKAEAACTIIASVPSCDCMATGDFKLDEITRLPKAFFSQDDSTIDGAVYVGQRKVHGLDYEVWSLSWTDAESEAKIVEEIYFLQVTSSNELSEKKETYLQISHVDMYTYETNDETSVYELTLLKYFSINNFKSAPKEWVAFDIATCFRKKEKIEFVMNAEGPEIARESQTYREVLQQLYNKIIAATGVSIVRISELRGVFDGTQLLAIRGAILENSESGWPTKIKEPGMEETFELIKKAVSDNKLSITFKGENNMEIKIDITSVRAVEVTSGDFPKPTIPDVFQIEIEGIYKQEPSVIAIRASMFFDRENKRAALLATNDGSLRKYIYNFDSGESILIEGNGCNVQEITEEQIFFPFTFSNDGKTMIQGDEVFSFSNSKPDKQFFPDSNFPTLVYEANINMPQYGNINCEVVHVFSKPDVGLPSCTDGLYCNSTLLTMAMKCKNEKGQIEVDNSYRFSHLKSQIEDESVFLPPAGIHCDMKSAKIFPSFPSYFSFTFDTIEKPQVSRNEEAIFTTHKEVWFDAEFKIIRIDEFDYNGILYSSRIFDLKAEAAFTIVPSVAACDIGPVTRDIKYDEVTRLPRAFFYQNDSTIDSAVYVGKRNGHGLDYQVWSLSWSEEESQTKIVEEIYFLEVTSNKELSLEDMETATYLQISHVDMYTYEPNDESNMLDLTLVKYFAINNYRSKPKEWAAFDVDICFTNKAKKEFIMKVEGSNLVKGSKSYREVLELLYNKIIDATGVSIVRISELTGTFDGVQLKEIKGLILDNSESSGWPKNSKEPNMEEAFNLIKKAASENKLSVTVKGENNIENKVNVTSVEAVQVHNPSNNCYSGASLAAASLVLLLMGIAFGITGYYVFLKKRKPANVLMRMSDIDTESI